MQAESRLFSLSAEWNLKAAARQAVDFRASLCILTAALPTCSSLSRDCPRGAAE
jgi:hypothetical protein